MARDLSPGPFGLSEPVDRVPGVGPKVCEQLGRLGLFTVADLLLHLPFRYEDRTRITPLASLSADTEALIVGEIVDVHRRLRGKVMLSCTLDDGTGQVVLRFFHATASQMRVFIAGRRLACYGRPRPTLLGFEFVHPQCRFSELPAAENHLTPVYRSVAGLSQMGVRRIIGAALERMPIEFIRPLAGLGVEDFASTADVLWFLHCPPPGVDCNAIETGRHPASRRLALEELLGFALRAHRRRSERGRESARPLAVQGALVRGLRAGLPFTLTSGQERAAAEILADMALDRPMRRLLQGDVGCGKTIVAALAAAQAVDSGAQVALMAPTELLAEQHWRSFDRWFAPLSQKIVWLSGPMAGVERRTALAALATGEAVIAVGTHALFQQQVRFHRLGLIMIDEQHRFGVSQRAALADKAADGAWSPHQLVMSATPIPRTLAQTAYADLDISEIRERPPARRPVTTSVLPGGRRAEVIRRIRAACGSGRQAYWVCPVIDESPSALKAAISTAATLRAELPGIEVGLVHGRLSADEKGRVMREFSAGRMQLLVATTVIEVGVDVPNASLMIVEHAERMGLAQLHQLRGRVGRGSAESHCVLLYAPPLVASARARLQCLRETDDGFAVAEQDLALRGPGELFGSRQAGQAVWRVADLARDRDLLPVATALAGRLEREAPDEAEVLRARWSVLHDLADRA